MSAVMEIESRVNIALLRIIVFVMRLDVSVKVIHGKSSTSPPAVNLTR